MLWDAQHHHPHVELTRLILGELTSLSYVHPPAFLHTGRSKDAVCTRGLHFFDVSHT